jgi:hypothetical protein
VRTIIGNEISESVAGSIEILAEMHQENSDLPSALRSLKDARDIRLKLHGKDHWRAGDAERARRE